MLRKRECLWLVALFFLCPRVAWTHQIYTGYTAISLQHDTLEVIVTFDLTDLARVFALDADSNGVVERQELLGKMPEMYDYVKQHFELRLDYLEPALERLEGTFTRDDAGNVFINFPFRETGVTPPGTLTARYDIFDRFGNAFKMLGKIDHGGELYQFVVSAGTPAARIDLQGSGPSLGRQLLAFVKLGIEHIFLGADHIMFLFGLLIFGGSFLQLVKIVSSFTVAHSVTLILAALQIITLPTRLVESVIALSIVYIAVENFYLQQADRRWIVTGLFGFVHGFGFANVLRDIGLPSKGLIASLFAFNLGVEIGQVVIVAAMLPVIWLIARSRFRRQLIFAISSIILLFGATWFLERAFRLPVSLI